MGKGASTWEQEGGCRRSPSPEAPTPAPRRAVTQKRQEGGCKQSVVGTALGDSTSVVSLDPQPGYTLGGAGGIRGSLGSH